MVKIVGREVSSGNKLSWIPAENSFPMRYSIAGSRSGGTFALLLGAIWIYFFIDDLFKALRPTFVLQEFLMMALIVLPGIFVLTYGISQYVYREETIIDRKSVLWRRRGLSGNREWRELISNYQGVLKEHQYWHGGHESTSRRSSHMVYSIRLTHPDPGKEVVLYRAESSMLVPPTDWAEKWKQYSARLQLPVLEKTEKGISSSDVNDLETPLVDKIREGKLKVATIDPNNVALGLMAELTRDDGMWIITCYSVWNAWKSIAGVIILTVGLTGAYSFKLIDPQIFRYFLWFIPVCVLAVSLSIRKQLAHPEQLAIDKMKFYYRHFQRQAGWVVDDMPLHSITNISVKSNPRHFRSAADIVIDAKNKSIRFGWWLPNKTKRRIESLLLSLIANDLIDNGSISNA
jgi:hypothetical protein